jgi:hypothetical protein
MAATGKSRKDKKRDPGKATRNGKGPVAKERAPVVSAKERSEAEKRLEAYLRQPRDDQLALCDRVIQALRRHQEQLPSGNGSRELFGFEELAKALRPWPADILADVFTADGKPAPKDPRPLGREAKSIVERAFNSLKEEGLIERSENSLKLSKLRLPDDLGFSISPDLTSWLPPQSEDEISGLEHSLLIDGPEDPLHVWEEKGVLIDGHTRVQLLLRHGRLDQLRALAKEVVKHSFKDIESVRAWMEERQGARRNQSRLATMYFLGLRYNREKRQGERSDLQTSAQNERRLPTDTRLGKEYGYGATTIRRSGELATSVDQLIDIADKARKGDGAKLRTMLLRQPSRGFRPIKFGVVLKIGREKNSGKQERWVKQLLSGEPIGKSPSSKGRSFVRLPAHDVKGQIEVLSKLGREALQKLKDAIEVKLKKADTEAESADDEG